MRRRIGVVCLVFVLAMLNMASASAAESKGKQYVAVDLSQMCPEEIAFREQIGMTEDTPQPLGVYVSLGTTVGLTISSSGDATCSGVVSADHDVKKIQIFLYLQKDSTGENVTSWMDQKDSYYFSMTRHHQLTEHGTYIVKMSAYVQYQDSSYDHLTRYGPTDTY